MKWLSIILISLSVSFAQAADKMKMNYNNEELSKVIEAYSKASGQKFVVDPGVRGKISIFIQEPISMEEAFNQLSSALAVNGFGISKQGDTMVIKAARNIQRDLIEVSSEKPSLKPERMYTWVYTAKHLPVATINRDLRILVSRDGEMTVNSNMNQLIFVDWVSNLHRIADLMKEVDKPLDPATAKLVAAGKKEASVRKNEQTSKTEDKKEKAEK